MFGNLLFTRLVSLLIAYIERFMEYRGEAFYSKRGLIIVMSRSSHDDGKWTSLSIRRSAIHRLEEFCETHGIVGNGEGIETLLTIAETVGVPLTEGDVTASLEELEADTNSEVKGFLLSTGGPGVVLVGTDGSKATVITELSDPAGAAQPMNQTQMTHANVYCPACGNIVLEYELSSLYPGIESGVFESLTVTCGTCESERPHYTLFVSRPEKTLTLSILKQVVLEYLAYVLIIESTTPDEFKDRVDSCRALAEDGDWAWLPDPSRWVGFSTSDAGPVTPAMYCGFLKSYLTTLVKDLESTPKIMGFEVKPPAADEEYFDSTWQLHLETRNGDPAPAVETLEEFTETWDTVSFSTEEVDADTFADHTVVISLNGLDDLQSDSDDAE